ncbi:MAG: hypothetical protein M0Z91_09420 [Actinomycetota bacterium]|nr:hypothetical protein [Actinomycetota bacterium]
MSAKKGKLAVALRLAEAEKRLAQLAVAEAARRLQAAQEAEGLAVASTYSLSQNLLVQPGRSDLARAAQLSQSAAHQEGRRTELRTAELSASLMALQERQAWTNAVSKLMEKRRREELYLEGRRATAELVEGAVRRMGGYDDLRS